MEGCTLYEGVWSVWGGFFFFFFCVLLWEGDLSRGGCTLFAGENPVYGERRRREGGDGGKAKEVVLLEECTDGSSFGRGCVLGGLALES